MKISLVLLTFNRWKTVLDSLKYNFQNAGHKIDEIIWIDNGSNFYDREMMGTALGGVADVVVLNLQNLGVAKGYNRGFALATGDLIVITGCDRRMPDKWLATLAEHFKAIPNTGVISIYNQQYETCRERFEDRNVLNEDYNGKDIIQAMPMGAKIFRRSLLKSAGYLREDFGLYGWEDVEWAYRLQRVLKEENLLSYVLPNFIAEHMGTEGLETFDGKDGEEYHAFKKREATDPRKAEVMQECKDNGFPFYSPY